MHRPCFRAGLPACFLNGFVRILPLILVANPLAAAEAPKPVGTHGSIGTAANPTIVNRLEITKPGVYENFLIDARGRSGNIVKITADGVTLRHCEIRNGSGNGIGVFGTNVVIENCRIHHMLAGTFNDQQDAHGIAGRWGDVTIRNCGISYISGDSIQFDPDRASRGAVVIENCRLWTGPLPEAAAGFAAGERPGENAVDTKTKPDGERCRLVIRNCHMHGWNQPAQIDNVAALNLKENIAAEITQCVFADNEVAFRVRGPGEEGRRGGAHVVISDCAIYDTRFGVRAEDGIEKLVVTGLAFGPGVGERIRFVNGKATPGYENTGEREAIAQDVLLKEGFRDR